MALPEKSLLIIRDFAPATTGRWFAPLFRLISRRLAERAKRLVRREPGDWILLGPQAVVDALGVQSRRDANHEVGEVEQP